MKDFIIGWVIKIILDAYQKKGKVWLVENLNKVQDISDDYLDEKLGKEEAKKIQLQLIELMEEQVKKAKVNSND